MAAPDIGQTMRPIVELSEDPQQQQMNDLHRLNIQEMKLRLRQENFQRSKQRNRAAAAEAARDSSAPCEAAAPLKDASVPPLQLPQHPPTLLQQQSKVESEVKERMRGTPEKKESALADATASAPPTVAAGVPEVRGGGLPPPPLRKPMQRQRSATPVRRTGTSPASQAVTPTSRQSEEKSEQAAAETTEPPRRVSQSEGPIVDAATATARVSESSGIAQEVSEPRASVLQMPSEDEAGGRRSSIEASESGASLSRASHVERALWPDEGEAPDPRRSSSAQLRQSLSEDDDGPHGLRSRMTLASDDGDRRDSWPTFEVPLSKRHAEDGSMLSDALRTTTTVSALETISACSTDSEYQFHTARGSLRGSLGEQSYFTAISRGPSVGGSSTASQDHSPRVPQSAGKGPPSKGKAGGKGAVPKAPPRTSLPKVPAPRGNGLTNIFWKGSHEPDELLGEKGVDAMSRKLHEACLACEDGDSVFQDPELRVPQRPETIFSNPPEVPQLPAALLRQYFSRSQSSNSGTGKGQIARCDSFKDESLDTVLHASQIQTLEITVKKFLIDHKVVSESVEGRTAARYAVGKIVEGVLRCDYSLVTIECLNALFKTLDAHIKEGSKIVQLVQDSGEEALDRLRHPEHHRLIFDLLKVPDIVKRLECMIFTLSFQKELDICNDGLESLSRALNTIRSRKEVIRRFFMTAHRFGQTLNKDSNAPKAERGFQLSTLEKLSQTKSTKYPRLSMMHFVIALLSAKDARDLFTAEDVVVLQKARSLTTHKVRHVSQELIQGLSAVRSSLDKKAGSAVAPAVADTAFLAMDRFPVVMSEFIEKNQASVIRVAKDCIQMVKTYKKLGILFDDLSSVWPPPKNANDGRLDLCDVFCRFAENVKAHREEVDQDNLRALLCDGQDRAQGRVCENCRSPLQQAACGGCHSDSVCATCGACRTPHPPQAFAGC
mmetsp:Transcript_54534/g.130077  ORF Transcript_54534/g.130077 Transcript_54534/m.130077 type:complete len:948 (+) Transcript_54534:84-2927(+)